MTVADERGRRSNMIQVTAEYQLIGNHYKLPRVPDRSDRTVTVLNYSGFQNSFKFKLQLKQQHKLELILLGRLP